MLYNTELKRRIINNPTAEYVLDNLSPIYEDGYVALNIINNIGLRLGNIIELCQSLSNEGNPISATWSLDIWESSLGLPYDPTLTIEERRKRILAYKVSRFSSNPYKFQKIIKDITGMNSIIEENVKKYTFRITIFFNSNKDQYDLKPVFDEIDSVKHSHIIYEWVLGIASKLQVLTQNGNYGFPLFMCGEEICGSVGHDYYKADIDRVKLNINTAIDNSKNYYKFPSEKNYAGEINVKEIEETWYMSDFNSEDIYIFGEDI